MRAIGWLILIVGLIWTVATTVTQVRPGERAVVRRFGRVLDETPGPGLFIGLPWGLDQVERVPLVLKRRVLVGMTEAPIEEDDVTPPGQLLTGDHNLVNFQVEINYAVREAEVKKYAFQQERADALVARAAEAALTEWTAGHKVDEVLLTGSSRLPDVLVERIQAHVRPYDLGVQIEQASVSRLSPPGDVKEAFEKVAQADAGRSTRVNEAQQLALRRHNKAEEDKYKLERDTASYAQEQTLGAKGEAEAFQQRLTQYRKLRDLDADYLNTLWLDEMTRIYAQMRVNGRIDVLDHFLTSEGLSITQFPLAPRKK